MPATPLFRTSLRRWPQQALIGLVRFYRFFLSPWLGSACRFEPTCSAYALQALQRHGAAAGSALAVHRLLRCHPWCAGGHDLVPEQRPRLFTRLLARPVREAGTDSNASTSPSP
jgi:putative membrane protein insertion efficiency factor